MESKEQSALRIIERFIKLFRKNDLKTSEPLKNDYSYQVKINSENQNVTLHVFFGKKGNKVVLQGNKELKLYKLVNDLIFGEKFFDEEKLLDEPGYPYIGTDESGKGDFFGPLVVAGVYLTPSAGDYLRSLGIRDSKELSDYQIVQMADKIKKNNEIKFDAVKILPEKYNEMYNKFGNLNRIMGWAHARVIENLLSKCDASEAISDKFGNEKIILDALLVKGRTIILKQVTKAEKFTAVAAASIIARKVVIDWFNIQSKKLKIDIPKGSSSEVEKSAKLILKKFGDDTLKKMIKLHFKTSQKVFMEQENKNG